MAKDKTSLRLQQILDLVSHKHEVSVAQLTARFKVTAATIRRDLDTLEQQCRITRTHGGAMLTAPSVVAFSFQDRRQTQMQQKQAIARAAVTQLKPGMTVILDTGTTTLEVAKALVEISNLKVLTSSLAITSALFAHENLELMLLGGIVHRDSPDLFGSLTQDNLAAFRADIAFIGADAIDKDGLYTNNQSIAGVSKAMIKSAKKVVVVADSSKFDQSAFSQFTTWAKVDVLVVDRGLNQTQRRWVKKSAPQVIFA